MPTSDTIWPTPGSQMPGASPDNKKVKNLLTGSRHSFYLTQAVEAERIQPGTITDSESCHSSQAAGEVCSAPCSSDGEQLPLLRSTPTASESSARGAATWPTIRAGNPGSRRPGTGGKVLAEEVKKASPSTPTSATSTPPSTGDRSTSSPEASPASRSVRPGSGSVRMTSATCGHTPFAYWSSQERRWDSSRMCLDFSQAATSEPFSETWPKRGSMRNGVCWEQTMSVPRIDASGCGYWPAARTTGLDGGSNSRAAAKARGMWPTATVDDANNVTSDSGQFQSLTRAARGASTRQTYPTPNAGDADGRYARCKSTDPLFKPDGRHAMPLSRLAAQWATPQANKTTRNVTDPDDLVNSKGEPLEPGQKPHDRRTGKPVTTALADQMTTPGSLNPTWVEWLMGWPRGWTDSAHSVTDRCLSAWLQRSRTWLDRLE